MTASIEYVQNVTIASRTKSRRTAEESRTSDNITIGDEYHYIMECEHFSNFRNMFIITNLRERPNILKFKRIMSQKEIVSE